MKYYLNEIIPHQFLLLDFTKAHSSNNYFNLIL